MKINNKIFVFFLLYIFTVKGHSSFAQMAVVDTDNGIMNKIQAKVMFAQSKAQTAMRLYAAATRKDIQGMLGVLGQQKMLMMSNDSTQSTFGKVLEGMTAYTKFEEEAEETFASLASLGKSFNSLGAEEFMSLEQLEELDLALDEIQNSAQQANDLYAASSH